MPGTNTQTLTGIFGDIADEIRAKDGSSATITPANMANAIANIPSGDTTIEDKLIQGASSNYTYTNSRVTKIKAGCFKGDQYITSASFPNVTTTGSDAFSSCTALTSVSLPLLRTPGNGLFAGCTAFTSISLPAATYLSSSCFMNCSGLTSVDAPNVTLLGGSYTFSNCRALTSFSSTATFDSIYAYSMFTNCSSLQSVSLPNAQLVGPEMFFGCTSLASVDLSSVKTIGDNSFYNCSQLTTIALPSLTSITNTSCFSGCSSLTCLNLCSPTRTGIPTLNNTNNFNNTPIASGTGYIYINDDLVNTLKGATNWSAFASQIKGESDLPTS
jgi:hypothetical protein